MNPKPFLQGDVVLIQRNFQAFHCIEMGENQYNCQHEHQQQQQQQYQHGQQQHEQQQQRQEHPLMMYGAGSAPYPSPTSFSRVHTQPQRQQSSLVASNGNDNGNSVNINNYCPTNNAFALGDSRQLATLVPNNIERQPENSDGNSTRPRDPFQQIVLKLENSQSLGSQRDHNVRHGNTGPQSKESQRNTYDHNKEFPQDQDFFENSSGITMTVEQNTTYNGNGLSKKQYPYSSPLTLLSIEIQPISPNEFRSPPSLSSDFLPLGRWPDGGRSGEITNDVLMNDLFHSELKMSRKNDEGNHPSSKSDGSDQQQRDESKNNKSANLPIVVQSSVSSEQKTKKESENEPNIVPQLIRDSPNPPETPSSTTKPKRGKVSTKGSKRKASSMAAKPRQRRKSTSGKKPSFPLLKKEPTIEEQILTLPAIVLSPSLLASVVANDPAYRSTDCNIKNGDTTALVQQIIRKENHDGNNGDGDHNVSPQEVFREILKDRGHDEDYSIELEGAEYDSHPSPLQLASFGSSLVWAVQSSDRTLLRKLLTCGLSPNPCNQFRDSILGDLVCKQGNIPIYNCFVDEFHAELQAIDGFGRTLLHHCCWAHELCKPIIEDILKRDPIQMFLKDKHGETCLDYVRIENRGPWNRFLREVADEHWPKGSALPRLSSSYGNRRHPDGDLPDSRTVISMVLAAKVSSGNIAPEAVAKMSEEARENYGKKR